MLNKLKASLLENRQPSGKYFTALDVGTEYIKALIGKVEDDHVDIIGAGRSRQGLGDMHSGAIADIDSVVANCEKALTEAEDQAGVSATLSVVGIAGELVKGRTSSITYKRPEPQSEMEMKELSKIMQQVQTRAMDREKKQLIWETGNQELEVKLVNSAVVSMHVDGYPVTNPVGFTGREFKIQLYTAFAPLVHIAALEKTANELDLDLIAVAAEPFAVSRAVTPADNDSQFSAVLIDVGGGTTDIAVVNEGGVEGTKMFGIGGRSFTQTIANELDVDFEAAEKLKLKFSSDKLEGTERVKVKSAIDKTLEVWLSGVQLTLSEFSSLDHLPSRVYLCGGGASLSSLVSALTKGPWYKDCAFSKQPSIHHIRPDQVIDMNDKSDKVHDHTFVTAMGLLRIGVDTNESTAETGQNMRDTINKLLKI